MQSKILSLIGLALVMGASVALAPAAIAQDTAQDKAGCEDHPALTRYPGTVLQWCKIENYMQYRVPVGPVTGYRAIGKWEETEGRVTRNFYSFMGTERTHAEIYKNFSDALKAEGFEIIGQNVFTASNRDNAIGGRNWLEVHFLQNKWSENGPVGKMVSGTSSSGGSGAIVARKVRADDTLWIVATVEQHSKGEAAMLIDFVETKPAETGLVFANADGRGKDLAEYGRTVIDGLMFDHDKATLTAESKPALDEAAKLLKSMSSKSFYVVGHTDSTGTYAYNTKLSSDRAETVRSTLMRDYGIPSAQLQAVGAGPISPVFTNATDGGKEKNRRVELVEK